MNVYHIACGPLRENCFILASDAKNAAIVDPGDDMQLIDRLLEDNGLTAKMILLTHGHFDHIGAVKELCEKYSIPVYAAKKEELVLASNLHNRSGSRYGNDQRFQISVDYWLKDGDVIELDDLKIDVMSTPGHTAGSLCYFCGDYMFSGDTLFAGDIGRCDLYSGNFAVMLETLEKLKKIEKDYQVLPGHGPASTLLKEKNRNPYMTGEAL